MPYPNRPTASKSLLTLSLLASAYADNNKPVHESEIEEYCRGNRASHYIHDLRSEGWNIKTLRAKNQQGSFYQMESEEQVNVARTFDISDALESLDNPPKEISMESLPLLSTTTIDKVTFSGTKTARQLALFSPHDLIKDSRFDAYELLETMLDFGRKASCELLKDFSTDSVKAHTKLSEAMGRIVSAMEVLMPKE